MKAEFDEYGNLLISATSNVERLALRVWFEDNCKPQGEQQFTLGIDYDSYREATIASKE